MFKDNNKDNRTLFDNVVSVYLFLSFYFRHVSYLVLMYLLLPLNMEMPSEVCLAVIGNLVRKSDMH